MDQIFYESKLHAYVIATVVLIVILYYLGFDTYLFLTPTVMLVWTYIRPVAKITITDNTFIYERGRKIISVPWSDVIGVHQDPVRQYLPDRYTTIGFFVETKSHGFTDYIGPMSKSKYGFDLHSKNDVMREISKKSNCSIQTGAVSMFKQRRKLWDIVLVLSALFIIPAIIIITFFLIYGPI